MQRLCPNRSLVTVRKELSPTAVFLEIFPGQIDAEGMRPGRSKWLAGSVPAQKAISERSVKGVAVKRQLVRLCRSGANVCDKMKSHVSNLWEPRMRGSPQAAESPQAG